MTAEKEKRLGNRSAAARERKGMTAIRDTTEDAHITHTPDITTRHRPRRACSVKGAHGEKLP
jgi:hypothetical protein